MAVTILECLRNAEINLGNAERSISMAPLMIVLAKTQLHNAIVLLEKGYPVTAEVETSGKRQTMSEMKLPGRHERRGAMLSDKPWTPGPWFVTGSGDSVYALNEQGHNRMYIAANGGWQREYPDCVRTSFEEIKANAHLIAAVPEQHTRLSETNNLLQRLLDDERVHESYRSEIAVQIAYNAEALAKARGEQS